MAPPVSAYLHVYLCACFPQADLQLPELHKRISEFNGTWLNTNMPSLRGVGGLTSVDVINVDDGSTGGDDDGEDGDDGDDGEGGGGGKNRRIASIRVGLLGLLTDEETVFSDGTFRGVEIEGVHDHAQRWGGALLKSPSGEQWVSATIPVTHQSIGADVREPIIVYTLYYHPLYTFITIFTPVVHPLYMYIYTIYTPNTHLNTPYTPSLNAFKQPIKQPIKQVRLAALGLKHDLRFPFILGGHEHQLIERYVCRRYDELNDVREAEHLYNIQCSEIFTLIIEHLHTEN